MFLPPGDSGFDQMTRITSQTCEVPYSAKDYGVENYGIGISLQAEHQEINSSSEPSICGSDDSSDVGITETSCPVVEESSLKPGEENDELKSLSMGNMECVTQGLVPAPSVLPDATAVEGSHYHDTMQSGNENGVPMPSFMEYPDMPVPRDSVVAQDSGVADNGIGPGDDLQMIEDGSVDPDSPGDKPAKRLRLTPSVEGEIVSCEASAEDLKS